MTMRITFPHNTRRTRRSSRCPQPVPKPCEDICPSHGQSGWYRPPATREETSIARCSSRIPIQGCAARSCDNENPCEGSKGSRQAAAWNGSVCSRKCAEGPRSVHSRGVKKALWPDQTPNGGRPGSADMKRVTHRAVEVNRPVVGHVNMRTREERDQCDSGRRLSLSRGLTLEGLMVSYFLRTSMNVRIR